MIYLDLTELFGLVNAVRFALAVSLLFLFGNYIRKEFSAGRGDLRIAAAIGFFIFMFGESGWRCLVWWNHGDSQNVFARGAYPIFLGFGIISAVGMLCCFRVLVPTKSGILLWIFLASVVGCVLAISMTLG